ncbi:MAG: hypothetical protein NW217_11415 [Hyphomicrobiaceae bacterium]|nr:hypothetical protein [Hyphomicrobiaceae bacterium]
MSITRGARSPRNIEKRKRKASHKIPRAKVTRFQGNTAACRKKLRKQALIRVVRAAAPAASPQA